MQTALLHTSTGWQVIGREGGADEKEVAHYFDDEEQARHMLKRMLDTVRPELANWAQMTASRDSGKFAPRGRPNRPRHDS
ncbi:hypothetical protein ACIA5D_00070 [Actinoplanes sp. NPDC051513]|uniref:hypothetical protein n=1 Tax=Actinoplanes sp. NPDC051513 TaxID=3363908 RepID=UPI0037A5B232